MNAFVRGVDRLAEQRLPVAIVLCTNRLTSIDPAVLRRAAEIFEFRRPNEAQRRAVVEEPLADLGFKKSEIDRIALLVPHPCQLDVCSRSSSLTPDRPVTFARAVELLADMKATPPFRDGTD